MYNLLSHTVNLTYTQYTFIIYLTSSVYILCLTSWYYVYLATIYSMYNFYYKVVSYDDTILSTLYNLTLTHTLTLTV
jgi:hypothetical protein